MRRILCRLYSEEAVLVGSHLESRTGICPLDIQMKAQFFFFGYFCGVLPHSQIYIQLYITLPDCAAIGLFP